MTTIPEHIEEQERIILSTFRFYVENYGIDALERNGNLRQALLSIAEQSRDEALKEAEEAVDAEMKHWRVTDGGLVFMSGLIRAYNAIRSLSTNKE